MNKEEIIYLDDKQAKAFMIEIEKIKDEDPSFKDDTCDVYEDYVYRRAMEIAFNKNMKNKLKKNRMYEISKSMFEYITHITGVNVMDDDYVQRTIDEYNGFDSDIPRHK